MRVNIIKFDHFGRGLGRIKDKVIFINKALPNEVVDVLVTKNKKHYQEGKITHIIEKSQDRTSIKCPFYQECGGCNFLHTTYNVEKDFKIQKGRELLGRVDSFYETKQDNYRNKVTLHVKDNQIGYYKEETNDIISINYCYLLNNKINEVIDKLNKINWSKYNIKKVIIKCHQNKTLLDVDENVDNDFLECFSNVDTIIVKDKVVKGKGFLEEIIDGKTFKITSKAFFQVNNEGLENINLIIRKYLMDKKINTCLDLYSGTGLWGILLSSLCKKVTSIEINQEACRNNQDNIRVNSIKNIRVINGKVEDYIDTFKDIDLVIVDPPRSGLDRKTKEYLNKIKSHYLIYISCDMQTLKRDLEVLKDCYTINEINLVDMFKRTYHCETVCLLCHKTVDK